MSVHPLIGDLSTLTDSEVHDKYNDLSKKLNFAYRTGNGHLADQIRMVMGDYQEEVQRRNDKIMAALANKNPEFKNIIDVG